MSKAKESFNFIFHGNFNINPIVEHLKKYNSEWFLNTTRQDAFGVHKYTNSIFIYDHDANWKKNTKYSIEKATNDEDMLNLISPIIKVLEEKHNGKVGKVLFIRLSSSKNIDKHVDVGDYLESIRRHHVPIITNDNVSFVVGNETKTMRIGEIWEVNNNKMHEVLNAGDDERVHLLIDIIPNNYIGEDNV